MCTQDLVHVSAALMFEFGMLAVLFKIAANSLPLSG